MSEPDDRTKETQPGRGVTMVCAWCGKTFTAERTLARWCSAACKQAAYRHRNGKLKSEDVTLYKSNG